MKRNGVKLKEITPSKAKQISRQMVYFDFPACRS